MNTSSALTEYEVDCIRTDATKMTVIVYGSSSVESAIWEAQNALDRHKIAAAAITARLINERTA